MRKHEKDDQQQEVLDEKSWKSEWSWNRRTPNVPSEKEETDYTKDDKIYINSKKMKEQQPTLSFKFLLPICTLHSNQIPIILYRFIQTLCFLASLALFTQMLALKIALPH